MPSREEVAYAPGEQEAQLHLHSWHPCTPALPAPMQHRRLADAHHRYAPMCNPF